MWYNRHIAQFAKVYALAYTLMWLIWPADEMYKLTVYVRAYTFEALIFTVFVLFSQLYNIKYV